MAREINDKIDALFVEGPDDGAVVNALVRKLSGIDLAKRPYRVVRTLEDGGGDSWALREFERYLATERPGARVGLIVDRDEVTNDKWPAVSAILHRLGVETRDGPTAGGAIIDGRYGIWMWPDNTSHGDLETFVAGIVPQSALLTYASEACRVAKGEHAAEYELRHVRKAALKVRSVWRDASAAGGYGHLVRNLELRSTPASDAFLAWFTKLFLT
ncbi:MAG TPA: DUF3226 domain-containing protein [Kofleriaceae bacterium]|nr:DUF3226 domain-containing protein [Kofleriaceae bacterium]